MELLDLLLLPKKFYKKFTAKKSTLFIGIVLDGLLFMILTLIDNFTKIFHGKSIMIIYFNVTLAVIFIVLIGFIDVIFFSIPIFDLFKTFKKGKEEPHSEELLIKFMKVYVCASIVTFPINLIFGLILRDLNMSEGMALDTLVSLSILLPSVWFASIVSRGANELYDFHPFYKRLVFLVSLAWGTILAIVLWFIMHYWLMLLFR